jgi:hypothetical protein
VIRVWRYQRGNQNLYIKEEQTTKRPKEKVQKDKQRSTKHTHKTKDRETQTPLKPGGEFRGNGGMWDTGTDVDKNTWKLPGNFSPLSLTIIFLVFIRIFFFFINNK